MTELAIFDMDGTLIDSVDLHAASWQQAFSHFGHDVSFEQARGQIGKGGDNLLPTFLSEAEIADHGKDLESWRAELFKSQYFERLRPFSSVPELLMRIRDAGMKVAVASSAQESELDKYLSIAKIRDLVDVTTSSADAEKSKPDPGIFVAALHKAGIAARAAIAIGDSPYDAEAAARSGMRSIGLLCGGFTEASLREAGCSAVYPSPGALWACFDSSPIMVG